MPALIYRVQIDFEPGDAYSGDPEEVAAYFVLNSARNERGFEYFDAVDEGRKGFTHGPHVRALHWVEGGEDVFRESVGPAVPRNLRQAARDAAEPRIASLLARRGVRNYDELQSLVYDVAAILMDEITVLTPVRYTGDLKGGYYLSAHGGFSVYDVNGGPYGE